MRPQYCTSTEFRWAGARSPTHETRQQALMGTQRDVCMERARRAGGRGSHPVGQPDGGAAYRGEEGRVWSGVGGSGHRRTGGPAAMSGQVV